MLGAVNPVMNETHMPPSPFRELAVDWVKGRTNPCRAGSGTHPQPQKLKPIKCTPGALGCSIGLGVTPAAEAGRVFLRQLKATFSLVCPQQGPPVAEMMVSLGPKEVRERIQKVLCS